MVQTSSSPSVSTDALRMIVSSPSPSYARWAADFVGSDGRVVVNVTDALPCSNGKLQLLGAPVLIRNKMCQDVTRSTSHIAGLS